MSLVLGLGLEHSCPWPRERLSLERLSLALVLASDFFCVLGLGLEPCVLDSTSVPVITLLLEMSMNFPIKKTEEKVSPRPNFTMADYGTICSYLHCVDWNNIIACHGCDIHSLYDCFLNILSDCIELFVPKFTKKTRKKKPSHIKRLLKEKQNFYQLAKINPMLKPNYKKAAKVYEDAVNQWADLVELSICDSANKSRFYGYANSKLKNKSQIPPLKNPGGLASSDAEKAECLNDFFLSVFKI